MGDPATDVDRQNNCEIQIADVRGVLNNRSILYKGGVAASVALIFASFLAPSLPSMLGGLFAGVLVLLWSAVNIIAQKSLAAKATRLLSGAVHAQALRVRFYKRPPQIRNSFFNGALYYVDKNEFRFIAQGVGLHRLSGEQEVLFLEDESDPGFALMKTPNGSVLLFLHQPRPGLPPNSELEQLA